MEKVNSLRIGFAVFICMWQETHNFGFVYEANTQETYGKGPEYYSLNSAFCPLLEMQTYFWIKFGLSTEIGE